MIANVGKGVVLRLGGVDILRSGSAQDRFREREEAEDRERGAHLD